MRPFFVPGGVYRYTDTNNAYEIGTVIVLQSVDCGSWRNTELCIILDGNGKVRKCRLGKDVRRRIV